MLMAAFFLDLMVKRAMQNGKAYRQGAGGPVHLGDLQGGSCVP